MKIRSAIAGVLAAGAVPLFLAAVASAAPDRALDVHAAEVAQAGGGKGASPQQMAAGQKVYQTLCIACHQPDGKGLPGAFPPLAASDYLLADKRRAAAIVSA